MKISAAEQELRSLLNELYPPGEAAAMVNLLMKHLTGFDTAGRKLKADKDLTGNADRLLEEWKPRLASFEPVQYLMNQAHFYGLDLYVDRNVLIPRPETEELVHWILADLRTSRPSFFEKNRVQADATDELKILDVGTGSGCIALALKKNLPRAEVWGNDLSEAALTIARRNSSDLDIRVDFQGLNFLDRMQQRQLPSVDIVVSNPPYIPRREASGMDANVLNFEPHTALFVENDNALVFYEALADFGQHRLHKGGMLYMEIHEGLRKGVESVFNGKGYSKIECRQDMQRKDRMIRVIA